MTIIVLYILLGIIAFIVILLHFSVRAEIRASKKGVDIKVKWLFITLYPRKPKKSKKPKKAKKGKAPPEQALDEQGEPDLSEEALEEFIKEAEQTRDEAGQENTEAAKEQNGAEEVKPEDKKTKKAEKAEQKKKAKKEKTEKKNAPSHITDESKEKAPKKKGKIAELKDKFNMIKPYIPMGWKYFRKILKKIRFTNIEADVTVGKEDAYEAAVWYGKVQGIIFGSLGWLASIFTVKVKHIDVHCRFNEKITDGEIYLKVKVRPSTMIHIAFCMALKALCIFIKQKNEKKRRIEAAKKKRAMAKKAKQKAA